MLGGEPKASGMIPVPLPPHFASLATRLVSFGIFNPSRQPNHVLVNEYDGDQGILHHKDGPVYYPCVAIITLNGSAMLSFKKEVYLDPVVQILMEPRSLVIFQDDLFSHYFHGINPRIWEDVITPCTVNVKGRYQIGEKVERTLRLSLTLRYVPSVEERAKENLEISNTQ
eukprot:TRINITY_DN8176_c0_g1_i1.p1 TRINITY_DN8176_c0_g1~~TRINITY_DN8176_c0_g1_i1.p1  ORF type:complete len:170 (+),score=16.26 TRINITY_DN8176_c0_g1_i1:214-723(+)